MPTLFLICGLPGAGKTTLAKRLEQERRALRLTPDDWMMALGIDLYDESKRAAIEALQWTFAERTLTLGVDTILDFGFWSRLERDDFRRQANALGARVEVRFLDLPGDELWARLSRRNNNLAPGEVQVDKADLDRWARQFEPPTPEELQQD
jgi:predicted kinase